jgi:hypothetical protein
MVPVLFNPMFSALSVERNHPESEWRVITSKSSLVGGHERNVGVNLTVLEKSEPSECNRHVTSQEKTPAAQTRILRAELIPLSWTGKPVNRRGI